MAASVSPGVGARKSPRRNPVSTATYKMSWIGDKAGGDITFPTFRNNPQFDIFLKKPESMMVALTQDRDVELLEIGFYVVKGEGNGYPLPFISPSDVIAQSPHTATKTVELKIDLSAHKEPTHFVVIPCTKQPGAESKFSISFSCPNPDGETKIEVIRQQWAQILVQGAWEIQGGTHNSPTFFDNPQYTLSISNYETNVHIRIEQQSPSDGEDRVGFYLIKENELSSFMYKAGARIGFTSSESAHTLLKAKPREKYFLVPALLNGKDGAEYLITVLSDHSVNLCPTEVRLSSTSSDEKILVSAEPTPDLKAALPPPGVFSRKHHLLNTTTAKGEWSVAKKTAGGCVNFSTWRLNPQFILTASRKSSAIMSLRQRPEDSKIPFDIGFYVVTRDENEEKRKRKMNISPSQIVAKGVFQRSKEVAIKIDIDPSQSPYVVIPCTYQPNLESTFELNVASEGNQDWNLEICNDNWSSVSVGGRWTKASAGGCPEEATFGNNPQFQLKVLKPCDLQIVLTQPTAAKMNIIGFYVFKTVLGKVASVDDCDVAALGEFVDIEEVSARFKVPEMGMYTVVPCTLNAGEEGEFELSVFASLPSCEIFVKLLPL